ncbi:hypothetical protein [Leptospira sp. GIMC2001]|uniref:hypothetical protein n=1 Tax=Leptospira sp. GIMC2001 TaxID=1513297 RepID=UPI00234AE92F|nr:hypothetical protein [Leptospira sp. GIMC2001]WCL49448.1 hypothetical protein O4O04_19495 [Leptospira sp. GIMC2001]
MNKILISIFASFIAFSSVYANPKKISYRSNAFDVTSGKFIYSENHSEFYQNGEHEYSIIEYKDTQEKTFARKRIDFGKKRTQPDFHMEDFRTGYYDKSKLVNPSSQEFLVEHQRGSDKPVNKKTIKIPGLVVVDGGFDYFIRDDFDNVTSGQTIRGYFLLANRLDYFQCRVQKVKDFQYKGRDAVQFVLRPENFIIRTLADSIYVTYDKKTTRLLEYVGISNLQDDKAEDFPKVKIVFAYPKGILE